MADKKRPAVVGYRLDFKGEKTIVSAIGRSARGTRVLLESRSLFLKGEPKVERLLKIQQAMEELDPTRVGPA